jgi:hypothetical protein
MSNEYIEQLFYTNNSIGDAIGESYKQTVDIVKFRDFLNEMIEKGAQELSINSYQNGEYQRMSITRNRTGKEIIENRIKVLKEELEYKVKQLNDLESNESQPRP